MFGYISVKDQLIKERQKSAALKVENDRNAANIDYIAMVFDVELENEKRRCLKMSQSKKYAKVKDYYERGLWDIRKVYDAVVHKWITAEEYKEITGYDFDDGKEA